MDDSTSSGWCVPNNWWDAWLYVQFPYDLLISKIDIVGRSQTYTRIYSDHSHTNQIGYIQGESGSADIAYVITNQLCFYCYPTSFTQGIYELTITAKRVVYEPPYLNAWASPAASQYFIKY